MRAICFDKFGGPEVLKVADVPEPQVRPGDVLIEVHAAALNPVDTKIRSGGHGQLPLPIIPGYDVSGVVQGVGADVTGFGIGDEVYASPNLRRPGSHAQRVAVDARTVAPKPRTLDHVHAAALPLVTITAWESLYDRADVRPDETVLVQAGAGGVGHVAVQLAAARGCRVLTTAGREESIALCRQLGADLVIDYKKQDVLEQVMIETQDHGCDVVFDTVGGDVLVQCMDALAVNGRLVGIVLTRTDQIYDKLFRKNATLHLEFMGVPTIFEIHPENQGRILREAAALVDAGKLRPHIHDIIGLQDIPRAHGEQAEHHTCGKRVVKLVD